MSIYISGVSISKLLFLNDDCREAVFYLQMLEREMFYNGVSFLGPWNLIRGAAEQQIIKRRKELDNLLREDSWTPKRFSLVIVKQEAESELLAQNDLKLSTRTEVERIYRLVINKIDSYDYW